MRVHFCDRKKEKIWRILGAKIGTTITRNEKEKRNTIDRARIFNLATRKTRYHSYFLDDISQYIVYIALSVINGYVISDFIL